MSAVPTAIAAASPTPEEMPTPKETPFPEPIRLRLRKRVLALDYAQCSHLLRRLLAELGYEDVSIAGRTTLLGYNRPGGGGWDLAATLPAGVGSRHTVIRLKHTPREPAESDPKPIHQRCVDELRGACLRAGAAEGLLVTTGEFSLTARRLAARDGEGNPVAAVRLVDGDELVEMLLAHRIGVREVYAFPGRRRLEVDEGFFDALRKSEQARSLAKTITGSPPKTVTSGAGCQEAAPPVSGQAGKERPRRQNGRVVTWRTHAAGGVAALWLIAPYPALLTDQNAGTLAAAAALGALLPDLDAADAKARHLGINGIRPLEPVGDLLHALFGHRGLMHSLPGLVLFALLVALPLAAWWGAAPSVALVLGYASHLVSTPAPSGESRCCRLRAEEPGDEASGEWADGG